MDSTIKEKFRLRDEAAFHTETNTKLILLCDKMYRRLAEINELASDTANLSRIRELASGGISLIDSL